MGSASSKAARGAARKYPTAPSKAATTTRAPTTKINKPVDPITSTPQESSPSSSSSSSSSPPADDVVSGEFSRRLQQMGVVQPNPTYSSSSTAAPNLFTRPDDNLQQHVVAPLAPKFAPSRSNPTLSALASRRCLQEAAETEIENIARVGGSEGRRFVDIRTVVNAVRMREGGVDNGDIEREMRLEGGLLKKLGRVGVLSHASTTQ